MQWERYCRLFIPRLVETYRKCTGRKLDINNPVTFTEKIQWLKIYDSTMLKTFSANKITVHRVYKGILGVDIGIPIIAVYNAPSEIQWDKLPSDMVLKCNHGSGYNIVLHQKTSDAIESASASLSKWLEEDYASRFYEMHYALIPRKILVEPYISDLTDIKIFCFNGKPSFYQIDKHAEERRMNFYDMQGNPLTWLSNTQYPANYAIHDNVPSQMDKLIDMSYRLSRPFKFVRVDFYIKGDKIYGGELTFTPGAGIQTYAGGGDRILGQMLDLQ